MSRALVEGYFKGEYNFMQRMERVKTNVLDDMSTEDFHATLIAAHGQPGKLDATAGTGDTVTNAGAFMDATPAAISFAGIYLALKGGPNFERSAPLNGSFIKSNTDDIATLEKTFDPVLSALTDYMLCEGGIKIESPLGAKYKVEFFDAAGAKVAAGSCDVYIDRCDRVTGGWDYGWRKHIGGAPQHGVWQEINHEMNATYRMYVINIAGAGIASVKLTMEAIR